LDPVTPKLKGLRGFRGVVVVLVPEDVVVGAEPGVGVVAVGGVAVPLPPPGVELPPVEVSGRIPLRLPGFDPG
jgi:hypothetical protein